MPFDRDKWKREWREKNKERLSQRRKELRRQKIQSMTPEELKDFREKEKQRAYKWRRNNPLAWKKYKLRETQKQFGERWRITNILSMGGKCLFCEYNDNRALEFHHLNKEEKDDMREARRASADLTKFILLCANCHKVLHASRRS